MESNFSSLSLSETTQKTLQNSGAKCSPSSVSRLWRPAAQRNMKNQWSKLNSLRQEWLSSSSAARSHATSVVNAYLSQRYMKDMELGVLSDMPNIQKKACWKLLKQQVIHHDKLVSSYKDMVATVVNMVNTVMSLRCFHKGGTNSSLIQFSSIPEDPNDNGDGGGMPVFTFWPVSSFEKLAWELVQMFKLELYLKVYFLNVFERLQDRSIYKHSLQYSIFDLYIGLSMKAQRVLVLEFVSLRSKEDTINKRLYWSDEVYHGEFDNLNKCNFDQRDASESVPPKLDGCISDIPLEPNCQPDSDVLQIYLTAWLTDVNIDKHRVEDIFSEVGEEMHVNFAS